MSTKHNDVTAKQHTIAKIKRVKLDRPVFWEWRSFWNSFPEIEIACSRCSVWALVVEKHHAQIRQQLTRGFVCILWLKNNYICSSICSRHVSNINKKILSHTFVYDSSKKKLYHSFTVNTYEMRWKACISLEFLSQFTLIFIQQTNINEWMNKTTHYSTCFVNALQLLSH